MDNLFKQPRVKFSGPGQEKKEEPGSGGKDRKIPPQKTQSFKDKKKEPNWFRRQFSRSTSQDYDSNDGVDYAIAVAATAYAISSLIDPDQRDTEEEPGTTTVKIKGKKEDTTGSIPEPGRVSKRWSGHSSEITDSKLPITAATDTKKPEKSLLPAPSLRKTPSSVDKQLSSRFKAESSASRPDSSSSATSFGKQPSGSFKPDLPTTVTPALAPETRRQSSTRPGMRKTQADNWEEAEMAKIKERNDKQKSIILDWEDKKKTKAKRRLQKTERELEGKRGKALEKFRSQMQYIDQVAGGARAKAEEKKKNDTLKVKEKANTIRRTGKVPKTCFSF